MKFRIRWGILLLTAGVLFSTPAFGMETEESAFNAENGMPEILTALEGENPEEQGNADALLSEEELPVLEADSLSEETNAGGVSLLELTEYDGSFRSQLSQDEILVYDCYASWEDLTKHVEYANCVKIEGYRTDYIDRTFATVDEYTEYKNNKEYQQEPEYQSLLPTASRALDAYIRDNSRTYWIQSLGVVPVINPEWTDESKESIRVYFTIKLYLKPYYSELMDEIPEVEAALEQAKTQVQSLLSEDMSEFHRLKVIRDYTARLITYPGSDIDAGYYHTISGPLLKEYGNQGVCEGYAKLFTLLCRDNGFPCLNVEGSSYAGMPADHMWNYVQMEDGNWYLVDVTWDDGEIPFNTWLLSGDSAGQNHIPLGTVFVSVNYSPFVFPVLSTSAYDSPCREGEEVWVTTQEPTCTQGGTSRSSCSVCGIILEEKCVDALGHDFSAWSVTKEPTGSAEGLRTRVCSRCGATEQAAIPKLTREEQVEAFVTRLYTLVLGRKPDSAGLADWRDQLLSGKKTAADVTVGFIFSDEYLKKKTADTDYIEMLYRTMMNRASDKAGKEDWQNRLSDGMTRMYVLSGFVGSSEFAKICKNYGIQVGTITLTEPVDQNPQLTAFIARLYCLVLGRNPDSKGQNDWCSRILEKTATPGEAAYGFVFSPEYLKKKTSDSDYVEMLYKVMMNRSSDAAGKADWMSRLAKGTSREEVLQGFVYSQEFIRLCSKYGL